MTLWSYVLIKQIFNSLKSELFIKVSLAPSDNPEIMARMEKKGNQVCFFKQTIKLKYAMLSNVQNLVSTNIICHSQVQLDQLGSKENEEKMENLDLLEKWDPRELKGLLVQREVRENWGYLGLKDLKVNWDLLDQ